MIRAIRREPLRRRGAALSVCLYHTRFSVKKKDENAEKCSRPGKNGAGGGSCLPGGRHVVSGILALGSEIEGDDDGENGDKISGAHLAGDRQKDKQAGEGQSDDALDAQEVIDPPPEVSQKFDISADTLRYYERIGLIPPVPRSKSGIRDYDEESCGWIEMMKCMRKAGVQIEALIEYVTLFRQGDDTADARKAILVEQRDQLVDRMADMQASLDRLNQKIENYERILEAERRLRKPEAV